jgi:chromosome segregation ATPase
MRVLCACLLVAALTGCVHHDHLSAKELLEADLEAMQEAVVANVPDSERVARLNESIDSLGQQLFSFEADRKRFESDLLTLNARPDATRAELEARIGQFDEKRVAIRASVFELHAALIAATTAEEWKKLFPYERAVLTDSKD